MLKCDLHLHTREDPVHRDLIRYCAKELIDHAARLKYDVLSITNHFSITYSDDLAAYAKRRGILLIPGAEIRIENKDVLVYGITNEKIKKIKSFSDLKDVPLVIAPHPFHVLGASLGQKLLENIQWFHALEYSHFYTRYLNPNMRSFPVSIEYNIPMVGTSDAHIIEQFGTTYSLVDAKKDQQSIFDAIINRRVKIKTRPLSTFECSKIMLSMQKDAMRYRFMRLLGTAHKHRQGDDTNIL